MASVGLEDHASEGFPRRKMLWIEFVCVMLFLYVPALLSTFSGGSRFDHDVYYLIYDVAYSFARIALVLFVVWVGDGTLAELGFRKPKWGADIVNASLVIGIAVAAVAVAVAVALIPDDSFRHALSTRSASLTPIDFLAITVGGLRGLVVAAYVIARLLELVPHPALALPLAAAILSAEAWRAGPVVVIFDYAIYAGLGFVLMKTRRVTPFIIALAILLLFGVFRAR